MWVVFCGKTENQQTNTPNQVLFLHLQGLERRPINLIWLLLETSIFYHTSTIVVVKGYYTLRLFQNCGKNCLRLWSTIISMNSISIISTLQSVICPVHKHIPVAYVRGICFCFLEVDVHRTHPHNISIGYDYIGCIFLCWFKYYFTITKIS